MRSLTDRRAGEKPPETQGSAGGHQPCKSAAHTGRKGKGFPQVQFGAMLQSRKRFNNLVSEFIIKQAIPMEAVPGTCYQQLLKTTPKLLHSP